MGYVRYDDKFLTSCRPIQFCEHNSCPTDSPGYHWNYTDHTGGYYNGSCIDYDECLDDPCVQESDLSYSKLSKRKNLTDLKYLKK